MSVTVLLNPVFYQPAPQPYQFEVECQTIGECLRNIRELHPEIWEILFDDNGSLQSYVNIYLNDRLIYPPDLGLMVKPSDRLYVTPMFGGG